MPYRTGTVRVLVTDDESGCRSMLKTILKIEGFQPDTAKDAETAIELLQSNDYDAVITDIMMPGMSGIDLLQHIRSNYNDLPVIMITGYSSIDSAINALQLGAQDYLLKPLGDCRKLIIAVRNAVENYRMALQKRIMDTRLTAAVEKERQALGRELHDLLCQDLASISMLSSVLKDHPDAKVINDLAKKSVSFVKGLCAGLFPVELEEAGIETAIGQLVRNQQDISNIPCSFTIEGKVNLQDKTKALHVYRIVQESVQNAIRHSSASRITVSLSGNNGDGSITVEDDGSGMPETTDESTGMGIHIMKHRAIMIGGDLKIQPGSNNGTRVTCKWQTRH